MLLSAAPAHAQADEPAVPDPPAERRTSLHVLIGAQAALHSADMISTVHALRLSGGAREGNPLLRPLSGRPVALAAVSSGINALQMYTIVKLHRRHPKIARGWALALIAVEAYAVTNNIRVAGQIRRQAAGGR
jgi:hypothetical protein